MKRLFLLLLILFFCFPFLHLLFYVDKLEWAVDNYFLSALRGSFVQAGLSTVGIIIFAFIGALGLIDLRSKLDKNLLRWVEALVLLPGFVPPLIFVLLHLKWLPSFPFGLWGVVFLHILMMMGLVAIILEHILLKETQRWSELCLVEGVSQRKFILQGMLPNLRAQLGSLFLFVFISCFTSFSIPFLVGGLQYGGVEVFIYEKIFLLQDWGQALSMALSLTFVFMLVSFFVFPNEEQSWKSGGKAVASKLLKLRFGSLLLFMPLPGLFVGLTPFWGEALHQESIWQLIRGTMILSFGCGLLTFIVASLICFCFLRGLSSRLLFAFVPPGWMFVGFSLFLWASTGESASFLKVILGLTIIFVPFLYRLRMFSVLGEMEDQVDTARVMGVAWSKIFLQVIWPQLLPTICMLSGIAAFWAAGDFAISSVLFQHDVSLALRMKSLMLNYRMDQALVLVPILLLVSIFVFSVFQGMSYVSRRKVV